MKTKQKLPDLRKSQRAPLLMLGANLANRGETLKSRARTTQTRSGVEGGND